MTFQSSCVTTTMVFTEETIIHCFTWVLDKKNVCSFSKWNLLLTQGTLRVLLVLLHDFPEFLCDYHYAFCDVIPPNCIQMRNLILSAFPRTMRLPDPFKVNLVIEHLPDINKAPRILTNTVSLIQPASFKKVQFQFRLPLLSAVWVNLLWSLG